MEMDEKKARYYRHKEEVEKNQKEYARKFKNKIGKIKKGAR